MHCHTCKWNEPNHTHLCLPQWSCVLRFLYYDTASKCSVAIIGLFARCWFLWLVYAAVSNRGGVMGRGRSSVMRFQPYNRWFSTDSVRYMLNCAAFCLNVLSTRCLYTSDVVQEAQLLAHFTLHGSVFCARSQFYVTALSFPHSSYKGLQSTVFVVWAKVSIRSHRQLLCSKCKFCRQHVITLCLFISTCKITRSHL